MPVTPFHWGPNSGLGLMLFKIFDFPTLLVSCVIIDVEPFLVLVLQPDYPLHGYLHTFAFGTVAALLTAAGMHATRAPIQEIMAAFKLGQKSSGLKIAESALFGVYSHVLLDSFLYGDIRPLYPWEHNPFLHVFSSSQVYRFCGWSFVPALVLYGYRLVRAGWRQT